MNPTLSLIFGGAQCTITEVLHSAPFGANAGRLRRGVQAAEVFLMRSHGVNTP